MTPEQTKIDLIDQKPTTWDQPTQKYYEDLEAEYGRVLFLTGIKRDAATPVEEQARVLIAECDETKQELERQRLNMVKLFSEGQTMREMLESYSRRFDTITKALTEWGWTHVTTEVELIEAIDLLIRTNREHMEEVERQFTQVKALAADKERIDWLEKNSGHFQDDSATKIELWPDDATHEWHLSIGKSITGYGSSIRSAIDGAMVKSAADKAMEGYDPEPLKQRLRKVYEEAKERAAWLSMDTAPRDGTSIIGLYDDGEAAIMWSERPVCMAGPQFGGQKPGWATDGSETDRNLPMDPPKAWRQNN